MILLVLCRLARLLLLRTSAIGLQSAQIVEFTAKALDLDPSQVFIPFHHVLIHVLEGVPLQDVLLTARCLQMLANYEQTIVFD